MEHIMSMHCIGRDSFLPLYLHLLTRWRNCVNALYRAGLISTFVKLCWVGMFFLCVNALYRAGLISTSA